MELTRLTAISPVDGRYRKQVEHLARYFSEFGLIKYRVQVEVEYFIALCQLPLPQLQTVKHSLFGDLRNIYLSFSEQDAGRVKEIEKVTNHDVKAVEYFIKEEFEKLGLSTYKEFIHFGLTSQDINNTAIPMSIKDAMVEVKSLYDQLIEVLKENATHWKDIPMLAKTHGQPASPTTLGKEIAVFVERMERQMELLYSVPVSGKFGGATGNLNAHVVAYPDIDWNAFADLFVGEVLGLSRSYPTTQIEHYDNLAALCQGMIRLNTILIDFSRDVWQYISMNYFRQRINKNEVGSSAMPHKVNPIDFENAEGNFGVANALFDHLALKLPISRLQRDLTDSTVLRNIGVPFCHNVIALRSLLKGISKLELDETTIANDLGENWAVVAEAIQTILRREGYPNPYEALKDLTRNNEKITRETIQGFIDRLQLSEALKVELRAITPFNYTGLRLK
ncbi:MAG: adenylosuccinate lyase [Cyclobacteriaceae bacterium]|nr:adenylosuccinate lyase [Cyclobacteriaceae bacterium]